MDESLDTGFTREVLSHESALTRYLERISPLRDEVAGIRQEANTRVFEAAQETKPRSPRAFLFVTARHLSTDRLRRQRGVLFYSPVDTEVFDRLVDEISPEQQASAKGELRLLSWAFDCLTPKSRRVLSLRRIQQYSQKEVATHLGVSEKTVQKHLSVGARRLTQLMSERLRSP